MAQNPNPHPVADNMLSEAARRAVGAYKLYQDYIKPMAGSAGRIAGAGVDLFPPAGAYDFAAGGYNAVKPIVGKYAPAFNKSSDLPILADLATRAIGAPPLPANAPWWQRYGEGAVTGLLNESNRIPTALKMIASMGGGDVLSSVAKRFGGPEWEKFGQWIGSLPGAMPGKLVVEPAHAIIPKVFAGPQAQEAARQADVLGTYPTFGAVANKAGRMLEKALGATSIVGIPINAARERMNNAILQARQMFAEGINGGPLPPDVNKSTIGTHIRNLAQQRADMISGQAKQNFIDLENDPNAGPSLLVDGQPILDAINQELYHNPKASASDIANLQARAAEVQSYMPGGANYRGAPIPNLSPSAMTLGQLGAFRTSRGAALQNMPPLDTVIEGRIRDAASTAMENAYNRLGMGRQFAEANSYYRQHMTDGGTVDQLKEIAAKPEQEAYNYLNSGMLSPSKLAPLVDPSNPNWSSAVSQFISMLGDTGQGTDFRADTFNKKMQGISTDAMSQLARDRNNLPRQDLIDQLRAAGMLGGESSIPPSRSGLLENVTMGGTVGAGLLLTTHELNQAGVPLWLAPLVAGAGGAGVSYGLESKPMIDAMTGRGTPATPLTDALYRAMPVASAAYNLDNPEDPRRAAAVPPRPPSILDQLNPPNPFAPPPAPQRPSEVPSPPPPEDRPFAPQPKP